MYFITVLYKLYPLRRVDGDLFHNINSKPFCRNFSFSHHLCLLLTEGEGIFCSRGYRVDGRANSNFEPRALELKDTAGMVGNPGLRHEEG